MQDLIRRFAPAVYTLSWVIMVFSFTLLVPAGWAAVGEPFSQWLIWFASFTFTLATGVLLWWRTRQYKQELNARHGFLLVSLVWIVLPGYAALPLLFTMPGIGWSRAYFEAMSALTATGGTVLSGLDLLAPSINIWRCFLQLIGGLGIMLLAIAILPFLGLGGMQIYKTEFPGPHPLKETRLTPRIAETARGLWGVYFMLSLACFVSYRLGGMSWTDAFMHMCTTVGLGGLSSHDNSFAYWNSPTLEWIAVAFMLLSGVSFLRYFLVWRWRSIKPFTRDAEVRTYVGVLVLSTLLVGLMLFFNNVYPDYSESMRAAAFQVVSIATTTGYATTDYVSWPTFVPVLLLFLGCFVSCAGSTGGGIKMIRMLVLVRTAQRELVRIIHPRAVRPIMLSGSVLPHDTVATVMAYMLIYGSVMIGLTMLLLASGLDVVTAFSAIIACLNNIGPGLAQVGPAGNYAWLNSFQLTVCSLAMVAGRLELLPVLVLLTPGFWRR